MSEPFARILRASAIAALTLALMTNCSPRQRDDRNHSDSESTDLMLTAPTLTSVYTNIFQPQCARCHQPGGSAFEAGATVDFSSQGQAFATLIGAKVAATDVSGTCGSVNLVSPGSAATSYVVATTIASYYSNPFVSGSCAPYSHVNTGSVALSDADAANLTGWINSGAANN